MYRQYEDPYRLEKELERLKEALKEDPEDIDIALSIEEIKERINFAWQDIEYDEMHSDLADEEWMYENKYEREPEPEPEPEEEELGKPYTYSIECSPTTDEIDIWGAGYAWTKDGNYGVEYNLCIDYGENCSAIYYMAYNPETDYMETDHDRYEHYELDPSDDKWAEHFKEALSNTLEQFRREDISRINPLEACVVNEDPIGDDELAAYMNEPVIDTYKQSGPAR